MAGQPAGTIKIATDSTHTYFFNLGVTTYQRGALLFFFDAANNMTVKTAWGETVIRALPMGKIVNASNTVYSNIETLKGDIKTICLIPVTGLT